MRQPLLSLAHRKFRERRVNIHAGKTIGVEETEEHGQKKGRGPGSEAPTTFFLFTQI